MQERNVFNRCVARNRFHDQPKRASHRKAEQLLADERMSHVDSFSTEKSLFSE